MGSDQREAYNEQKEKLFVFAAAGSSELDMMAMACHGLPWPAMAMLAMSFHENPFRTHF